jgi:hypothetical protein
MHQNETGTILFLFFKKLNHLFSALMHATIFGNVASIVARIYRRRQEYDMKVTLFNYCLFFKTAFF